MGILRRLTTSERARQLTWVLLVLLIAASQIQSCSTARCQTNYNVAFALALEQRSEAADDRYQAQVDYLKQIDGIRDGDPRRLVYRRAYIDKLAQADAQRQAAPIPSNPRCD